MDTLFKFVVALGALLADPEFWTVAAGIIGALVGLFRLVGVQDAAKRMERLHSALQTVADAAVKRGLTATEAALLMWQYLLTANADTMEKLKKDATPQVLGTMLEAKIGRTVANAGPDLIGTLGKDSAVFTNVAQAVEEVAARGFTLPSPVTVRAATAGPQVLVQGWQATEAAPAQGWERHFAERRQPTAGTSGSTLPPRPPVGGGSGRV